MPIGGEQQVIATEMERVEKNIPLTFERDDTFYSQIEKRPGEIVSSISMRQPLELNPGGKNRAWNSDGGDKGLGGLNSYDKAEINTVELEHAMQWTSRRKYGTDNSKKAIINSFQRDLASGMAEFRRFNDSLCMTAGNAVMATVTTVSTTGGFTTITLTTDGFGAKLLRMNDDYNVWDPTLTTLRTPNETTITYYDEPNKTIQVVDPSTIGGSAIQAGDVIVPSGYQTSPPSSILGIPYHFSSSSVGTWLGFNRATTPNIRANSVTAGGGLALPMARLAINKIGDRIGIKNKPKLQAWCHPCQAQAYEELAQEAIIINKEDKEEGIDLYFNDNMRLAGAPVKRSYSWDKTRIDFVNLNLMARAEFYAPRWYKDDNGNRYFPMRGASGGVAASNLGYIDASWQLYATNPAGLSSITGLTVPAGY